MARARGWWPIAVIVTVLVVVNVASNRLVPDAGYVPFAVLSSAVLLALAIRLDGRSWADLGLGRRQHPHGLRWGGLLAGSVLLVYLVAVNLPATRDLFRDDRVDDWSVWQSLYAALVRVPLGTVLLEEVAFRAVLPAVLVARLPMWKAVALSAAAFGLWHVLPSLGLGTVNPVAEESIGQLPQWVTVAASVGSTALVGVWFWFLKDRTTSLLTPMALHTATNGFGYLFAWWVWR